MTADLKAIKAKLRQEHGVAIHQFDIAGLTFLFRPLTIGELELANDETYKAFELEDLYVKAVTLYPEDVDFDDIAAGHVTQYADQILKASGFEDVSVIVQHLNKHRARAQNNIIFMMKAHIITAMPTYKDDDFDQFSMDELAEKLVMAETILSIQTTMGTEYYSPDAFKLHISELGEEDEFTVEVQKRKPRQKPKGINPLDVPIERQMTDEEYEKMRKQIIKKIRDQNENIDFVDPSKRQHVDYSALEKRPLEELKAMMGVTKQNDPIAQKLFQNSGRVRRTAQSMGVPYSD
jgi:hypothetical protein